MNIMWIEKLSSAVSTDEQSKRKSSLPRAKKRTFVLLLHKEVWTPASGVPESQAAIGWADFSHFKANTWIICVQCCRFSRLPDTTEGLLQSVITDADFNSSFQMLMCWWLCVTPLKVYGSSRQRELCFHQRIFMKVLKYHIRKDWQNKCWEITFLQWLHVKFSFFFSCHNVVLKLLLGLGTKNTGKHAFTSRSVSLTDVRSARTLVRYPAGSHLEMLKHRLEPESLVWQLRHL